MGCCEPRESAGHLQVVITSISSHGEGHSPECQYRRQAEGWARLAESSPSTQRPLPSKDNRSLKGVPTRGGRAGGLSEKGIRPRWAAAVRGRRSSQGRACRAGPRWRRGPVRPNAIAGEGRSPEANAPPAERGQTVGTRRAQPDALMGDGASGR